MKAKDLIDLLKNDPEQELYVQLSRTTSWDEDYCTAHAVTDIEMTPSGIFIDYDYHSAKSVKMPADAPYVGAFRIFLKNGEEFIPNEVEDFWPSIFDFGYYASYKTDNECVVLEYSEECQYNPDKVVSTVDDVDRVEVVTSVQGWKIEWTSMTFQEAFEFMTNLE